MRRSAALALVTGGALAVGTLAWYRLKGTPKAVSGIFPNGIAYARVGSGPKTLLFILGGPGMGAPQGLRLALLPFTFYPPYIEAGYTVWIVARRQNMPKGHTIADMAEDYAGLIADELDGKVDLVISEGPTGGWIGFCLAARHPDRLGHLVTASCGYTVSEQGKTIDHDFARLRVEGRWDDASALQFTSFYPDLRLPGVARVLGVAMGRLLFADGNPYRAHDGMVEAEAEMVFDARKILPQISVAVLLIGGDRDIYTPKEVYEETARLIPDCTLRLYEGEGITAVSDKRLPQDVLDFVRGRPAVQPERFAEQPTSIDQPAAATDQLAGPTPSLAGSGAG